MNELTQKQNEIVDYLQKHPEASISTVGFMCYTLTAPDTSVRIPVEIIDMLPLAKRFALAPGAGQEQSERAELEAWRAMYTFFDLNAAMVTKGGGTSGTSSLTFHFNCENGKDTFLELFHANHRAKRSSTLSPQSGETVTVDAWYLEKLEKVFEVVGDAHVRCVGDAGLPGNRTAGFIVPPDLAPIEILDALRDAREAYLAAHPSPPVQDKDPRDDAIELLRNLKGRINLFTSETEQMKDILARYDATQPK